MPKNSSLNRSFGLLVKKTFLRWILYSLLGLLILSIDPFGIGYFAEEESQKVLYELGGPLYVSDARNDITLVLVSDHSLNALYERRISGTNEWPLLYQDWAVLLKTIAAQEPRALFVDIYFENERVTDPSLPILMSALDRLHGQLPIYFAGGLPPYKSELLLRLADKSGLAGSSWEGFGNGVPLLQKGELTAALQLYQHACSKDYGLLDGCTTDASWAQGSDLKLSAMSVVWGSQGWLPLTAELEGLTQESYCSNNTGTFSDLLVGILKSAVGELWTLFSSDQESPSGQCLYHRVIDADELLLVFDHGSPEEKTALKDALENKVVLLGTYFEGLPDTVNTPTLGQVPGVALHAMMLDNLMEFGSGYIKTSGFNTLKYNFYIWSLIVLFLVIWISRREYLTYGRFVNSSNDVQVPFTGFDSFLFLVVSLVLTALAAMSTFYLFRFEPANAIGFLGLSELTRRMYGNWESSILKNWEKFIIIIKKFILMWRQGRDE